MNFSPAYEKLFAETHSDLEKAGAFSFKERFFGPNTHQANEIQSLAERYLPGLKGKAGAVDEVLKNRNFGQRLRTGIFGHHDAPRILNEHMARRVAQAPKEGRNLLPVVGAAGILGAGGTLAAQHALSAPQQGETGSGELTPEDLALLQNYYAPGGFQ